MKLTNNATSALMQGISNTDTSLTVSTGEGGLFPSLSGSDYFYCTLADVYGTQFPEIIKVTARSGDTFTMVRGQDNTTAVSWLPNSKVELRVVAANFDDLVKTSDPNTFVPAQTFNSNISVGGNATITGNAPIGGNASVGGILVVTGRTTNSAGTVNGPWTTAGRPATPTDGLSGFNTDLNKLETWDATNNAWVTSGGATGSGGDDVFYENGQTVTSNYTITTNKNAMSTGPITINSGITVTVPTDSVWVVL
jgi:hypothetical protein